MGKGRVESPNPEEVSPFLGGSSPLFDRFIGDGRSNFPFGQPCAEPAFHFSADISRRRDLAPGPLFPGDPSSGQTTGEENPGSGCISILRSGP